MINLFANMCRIFSRYLEEFEKKIPRAEMLELQVCVFPVFFHFDLFCCGSFVNNLLNNLC